MAIERKKYWQENGKWLCETSYWYEDTQNCSTAFVREVAEDEVPADAKPPAPVSVEVEQTPSSPPPVVPPAATTESEPQVPTADVQTSAEQQPE